jgi:hypothetical protein
MCPTFSTRYFAGIRQSPLVPVILPPCHPQAGLEDPTCFCGATGNVGRPSKAFINSLRMAVQDGSTDDLLASSDS